MPAGRGYHQMFFFSSRRRHTRLTCDWSSDVCSSDLVDRMKEMFCVEPDLMLRSPKPEQIEPDAQCSGQHADDCFTKRNRHKRALIFPESPASWRLDGYGFLKDGSTGSFTDWSRSQPSFSSLMCSIAIAFALASRSGRISYSETQQ